MSHFGILSVDKPTGWTSRRVVNRVQRWARPAKVGHAGTLDPLASGVLLLPVGPATRLTEFLHDLPKCYTATFLIGRSSPTDDTEAETQWLADAPIPTQAEIEALLPRFVGAIPQRPPDYSAVHVAGRRAYHLARQGQALALTPRIVTIHQLELLDYCYPQLSLHLRCGSGTYVRALGRDLAHALGTAAVMSALVRTAIGPYTLSRACPFEQLTVDSWESWLEPARTATEHLPQWTVDESTLADLHCGKSVPCPDCLGTVSGPIAALDATGQLVSILRPNSAATLQPVRNFPRANP